MKIVEPNNNITSTNLDIFATAYYALGEKWGNPCSFNREELLEAYNQCDRSKFDKTHRGLFIPTTPPCHSKIIFKVHPSSVGPDGVKAYLFCIDYDRVYADPSF